MTLFLHSYLVVYFHIPKFYKQQKAGGAWCMGLDDWVENLTADDMPTDDTRLIADYVGVAELVSPRLLRSPFIGSIP